MLQGLTARLIVSVKELIGGTIVNQQPPTFMRELCADGGVSPIL
jgi:hypothetical protein